MAWKGVLSVAPMGVVAERLLLDFIAARLVLQGREGETFCY